MADPASFEDRAEAFKLRAKPRPITQINRKAVMIGCAVLALLLFFAASVALDPPKLGGDEEPRELYNTKNKPKADALAELPSSYLQLRNPDKVPVLGPPLPGDIGRSLVQAERELGIEPPAANTPAVDFRADPRIEAERAEAIRQAKIAQDSLESSIFFAVGGAKSVTKVAQSEALTPMDPFEALRAEAGRFAGRGALPSPNIPQDPNLQASKSAFAARSADAEIYNRGSVVDPVSPYQVMAGTIIPASLITGLNSDLPGSVLAQVTQPIFDTVTAEHLLIPQGARLMGRYDNGVSFGQERALVVWDRIIFPDGSSVQIDALPGADRSGYAGLSDKTDHHWGRVFTAAGLASLLAVGTELSAQNDNEIADAIRSGLQDTAGQAGERAVSRNLDVQPTIKVRAGWPVRVIVTKDLILRPYRDE